MRDSNLLRAFALPLSFIASGAAVGADQLGVTYGHQSEEQVFDLYLPHGTPSSTVLFIHGGSMRESGERRDSPVYADVCAPLVEAGIACATTDYRLSPSAQWPAMPEDIAAAIAAVREQISAAGGDPDELVLFGHSSGCHLAAVVGANPIYLATQDLSSSNIAGLVLMGCTLDKYDSALRGFDADRLRGPFASQPDEVQMYGTAENWIAANPAHHIGAHVPPTLVVLAEHERFFPSILEQAARFVRLLLEADVPADLVIVPGRHYTSIEAFSQIGDPTFAAVSAFINDPDATDGR